MRVAAIIKKNGIAVNAVITRITTIRTGKGGAMDILTMEYRDRATNRPTTGELPSPLENIRSVILCPWFICRRNLPNMPLIPTRLIGPYLYFAFYCSCLFFLPFTRSMKWCNLVRCSQSHFLSNEKKNDSIFYPALSCLNNYYAATSSSLYRRCLFQI